MLPRRRSTRTGRLAGTAPTRTPRPARRPRSLRTPAARARSASRWAGGRRRWRAGSPFEEAEAVERPEPDDDLADDPVIRLRAERARVARGEAVVAEGEAGVGWDLQGIRDRRRLRRRRAMRARVLGLDAVDVQLAVPQVDVVPSNGGHALHVWDGRVRRRLEHDDVAALGRADAVVDLAHEDAVAL